MGKGHNKAAGDALGDDVACCLRCAVEEGLRLLDQPDLDRLTNLEKFTVLGFGG